MTTWLHRERFTAVRTILKRAGVQSVIDLGCGSGDFLLPLAAEPWVAQILGVEQAAEPLRLLRASLTTLPETAKVRIVAASVLAPSLWRNPGYDAAVMIEVIEHLEPSQLSRLETALFHPDAPPLVILTTPNADFNPLLNVATGRFRHPDHKFEWSRARFRAWADGVALRTGYHLATGDVAGRHPTLGSASQMAVFTRQKQ